MHHATRALPGSDAVHDRADQLRAVQSSLLMGETVYAVYEGLGGGTSLLGLTNLRVVLQDERQGQVTVSLLSVPYTRVHAVGLVSASSRTESFGVTDTIVLQAAGGVHEVRLRDHARAQHAHDVVLHFLTR